MLYCNALGCEHSGCGESIRHRQLLQSAASAPGRSHPIDCIPSERYISEGVIQYRHSHVTKSIMSSCEATTPPLLLATGAFYGTHQQGVHWLSLLTFREYWRPARPGRLWVSRCWLSTHDQAPQQWRWASTWALSLCGLRGKWGPLADLLASSRKPSCIWWVPLAADLKELLSKIVHVSGRI